MTATTAERTGLVPPSPDGRAVLARFFRALGDPSRLALLAIIAGSGHTGCLGLAQSRVSAHLACLVPCGLIHARRDARCTRCTVRDERALELVRLAAEMAAGNAASVAACTQVSATA